MSFHLRRNLLFITFIIATIGIAWLLIQGLSYSFTWLQDKTPATLKGDETVSQSVAYVEKINDFSLQEFDANNKVSYFIKAKIYLNFKDTPALLLNPKIITYNQTGEIDYILTSERANYFNSGDIKFSGKVDVHSNTGITHKINTEELLVSTKTQDLISHKKITYLGEHAKIIAQGMRMRSKQDKMKLLGKISIVQDRGQKILTKNLYIDESNRQKHYYSKNKTTYLTANNKIYAQAMDLTQELLQLLGKVKILQNSGTKINTRNLVIDQSKDNEIYRTKAKIRYQSKLADIRAKGMRYDAKNQRIKLTGGVVGRYE